MKSNAIYQTAEDRDYVLKLVKEQDRYPEDVIAELLQEGYKLPLSIPKTERK